MRQESTKKKQEIAAALSEKENSSKLVFDENSLLPSEGFGRKINWNKVFKAACEIYYPKPINWEHSVDQEGNFHELNFLLDRRHLYGARDKFHEDTDLELGILKKIEKNHEKYRESCYKVFMVLKRIVSYFSGMRIGYEEEELSSQEFYIQLKNIRNRLDGLRKGEDEFEQNVFDDIMVSIQTYVNEGKTRVERNWTTYVEGLQE